MTLALGTNDLLTLLLTVIFLENFAVMAIYMGAKAFNSYRQTKATGTFFFAVSVIAVALAIIFLLLERLMIIFVIDLAIPPPFNVPLAESWALLMAEIAIVFSGIATVSIGIFAFNMAFSKRWKILAIIAAVLMVVYTFFWYYGPLAWTGTFEINTSDISDILLFAIDLPLIIIPMLVFFYYTIKARTESPRKSRMSLFMGLALLCFTVASAIEIIGFSDLFTPLLGRFLYIPAILFYYWGLFKVKGEK